MFVHAHIRKITVVRTVNKQTQILWFGSQNILRTETFLQRSLKVYVSHFQSFQRALTCAVHTGYLYEVLACQNVQNALFLVLTTPLFATPASQAIEKILVNFCSKIYCRSKILFFLLWTELCGAIWTFRGSQPLEHLRKLVLPNENFGARTKIKYRALYSTGCPQPHHVFTQCEHAKWQSHGLKFCY